MQNLNFIKCQNLNAALNTSEVVEAQRENVVKQVLKPGKHLSTDSYLKLMSVKKKLRDLFEDMQEKEKQLFEDNDYQIVAGNWTPEPIDEKDKEAVKAQRKRHKEISEKLEAIHKGDGFEVRKESRGRDKSKAVVKKIPIEGVDKKEKDDTLIQIPEPFIKREEFIEWTKDCSMEASSVLAEFLLVGFDKD